MTEMGGLSGQFEEAVIKTAAPDSREGMSSAMRRNLSSPWASAFVIILTILWTVPTFGLLVTSLRPSDVASDTGWWTAFKPPFNFTLDNYSQVLSGGTTIPQGIWPYFVNSFVISIPAAIVPLVIALMAAYGLAWVKFKWSNGIFLLIFALQIVPLQMALLPLLTLFNKGWFGLPSLRDVIQSTPGLEFLWPKGGVSFVPLWIAHTMFALPLAIFLLHNFIAMLPKDLFEAARVDGASHFLIFRSIVLPLSVPAIASFAIFQFLWVWNDLLVALTFAGGTVDVAPITVYLASIKGTYGAQLHLITAGAFIAIIVPLIVFFSLQRFFVRGLLAGSVKG